MALTTEPKRCLRLGDLGITEEHLKDIPIKTSSLSSTLTIDELGGGRKYESYEFCVSLDADQADGVDENYVFHECGKMIVRHLNGRTPKTVFQDEHVSIDCSTHRGRTYVKMGFVFIFE